MTLLTDAASAAASDPATLERRLRAVEDKLAIFDLIACHPLGADSGDEDYVRSAWVEDGVVDLGGDKGATGRVAIAAMVSTEGHRAALAGGLAHIAGLPHIELAGDTAIVTSYLLILAPQTAGEPVTVPNHGVSHGFRVHRAGVNRWDVVRTAAGWKIARRTMRSLDGGEPARDLLRRALHPSSAA